MPIPQVEDIQYLALNYSKSQLVSLARTGQINPQDAVMAGMMQDRIQKANAQPPSTTVAEDVLMPQMPQGIQGLPQQEMAAAEPMPAEMPVGMEGEVAGLEALPIPEEMYDEQSMAGGGIVAFEAGGLNDTSGGIEALAGIDSDLAKAVKEREAVRKAYLGEDTATKDFLEKTRANLEKAEKASQGDVYDAITMAGIEYARTGKLSEAGAAGFKQYFEGQAAGKKEKKELEKELLAAAGLDRKERGQALDAAEKAEQSRKELKSKEDIAARDAASRERIAAAPDKVERIAAQLRQNNPNLSYLDSIDQAAKAMAPKDTYNATRQAVTAAAEAVQEQIKSLTMFNEAFRNDYEKVLNGTADEATKTRVKNVIDNIQKRVYSQYQVGGVDISGGKINAAPSTTGAPPPPQPTASGGVDRNNPLLK